MFAHRRRPTADGFWSVSVYDADGFFAENPQGRYSVNDLTAQTEPDGSIAIHFGGEPDRSEACGQRQRTASG